MAIQMLDRVDITSVQDVWTSFDGSATFGYYRSVGTPEGIVTANPGSVCSDTEGKFWLKETGTGNTGWVQFGTSADSNFATDNLTADGDRTHDFSTQNLAINNLGTMTLSGAGTGSWTASSHTFTTNGITVGSAVSTSAGKITLKEASQNGILAVTICAAQDTLENWTFTMPDASPTAAGQFLAANTNGDTYWTSSADSSITAGTLAIAQGSRIADFGGFDVTFANVDDWQVIANTGLVTAGNWAFNTGNVSITNNFDANEGGVLRLYESTNAGSNFLNLRANADITATFNLTLPAGPPNVDGYSLVSDTNGDMYWAPSAAGDSDYRGAWADLNALNTAAGVPGAVEPFISDPASLNDWAHLLNAGGNATVAIYDTSAPASAPFVEVPEAGLSPDLAWGNQTQTTGDVTNTLGNDATLTGATQSLAGLMVAADKLKLDTIGTYTETYGDGAATTFTITHNLGTQTIALQVHETSGSERIVYPNVEFIDSNSFRLVHAVAPTTNQYRVAVTRASN